VLIYVEIKAQSKYQIDIYLWFRDNSLPLITLTTFKYMNTLIIDARSLHHAEMS